MFQLVFIRSSLNTNILDFNNSHLIYYLKGIKSKENNRYFHVGVFDTPTIFELDNILETYKKEDRAEKEEGCTFKNISDNCVTLHLDKHNGGRSVFQVASQFNCLEMVGPDVTPEHGISKYFYDNTQGI